MQPQKFRLIHRLAHAPWLCLRTVVCVGLALAGAATASRGEDGTPPNVPAALPVEAPLSTSSPAKRVASEGTSALAVSASQSDGVVAADAVVMADFLDRLMQAESGGRDDARNPRSTAVGPYQFIESTFLDVCRRHFATETAGLTSLQILALRTNRAFARRAAEAFTRDNAAILAANDIQPSKANLRLAFLLGSGGATRILKSDPATPVIAVLGANVMQANPFMAGMAARDLALWSVRNLSGGKSDVLIDARVGESPTITAGRNTPGPLLTVQPKRPVVAITCNVDLPACRKHIALAERRLAKQAALAAPLRRTRVR